MRCTKKQFEDIKPKLKGWKFEDCLFDLKMYPYLTNNYGNPNSEAVGSHDKLMVRIGTEIHETWNEKVFLEACGIEAKPRTNKLTELEKRVEVLEDTIMLRSAPRIVIPKYGETFDIINTPKSNHLLDAFQYGMFGILKQENTKLKLRIEELEAENKAILGSTCWHVNKLKDFNWDVAGTKIVYKTGWYKHSRNEFPKWLIFIDFKKKSFYGFNVSGNYIKDNSDYKDMELYIQQSKCIPAKKSEVIKRLLNESEFELKR